MEKEIEKLRGFLKLLGITDNQIDNEIINGSQYDLIKLFISYGIIDNQGLNIWTSVEDSLPFFEDDLFTSEREIIATFQEGYTESLLYDKGRFYCFSKLMTNIDVTKRVTHWMFLPSAAIIKKIKR